MRKKILLLLLAAAALSLFGCGRYIYPDLPADPVAFPMGSYIDEADDGAAYGTIEYEGRIYMPYGTVGKALRAKDIAACVGYLVQDGKADTDTRIYTLTDDPAHNYLMDYYIRTTLMNQPLFWRAADTRGREIPTPAYIDSLEYGFWE